MFVDSVIKERDPPWYAQPVPLEGCCVLHTPEIDHGAQDEEENPCLAPIHSESSNGFQMLYCGPRFGNGIAPSVFNDGCQGEGMGIGDNAGDKGEALTHEDRRHEAFGSGWGAAVGREVEEAEGEGIREGHVRRGILEDLPQRTEFKLVFPPWAWHLLLRPTKPHAPPSTSPHCHPHSRRDNSAQSWTLLNPKNVVSRDHCAAVPAAPSVTTTTREHKHRVVRVVHGRGHPRSR